jgi:RecA-family ATPase
MITLGGVIDMPKLSFDEATPVMSERAIQLKEAIICAADIKVDLTNDCLIKNWLGESAISVVYGDSNCGKSISPITLLQVEIGLATGSKLAVPYMLRRKAVVDLRKELKP